MAFVVPYQAGGSVLLQPHGHSVASVLPAVQKVAEGGREGQWGRGKQRERGCEVLYKEVSAAYILFLLRWLLCQ